jgi:SAM-dependent methyltransferase
MWKLPKKIKMEEIVNPKQYLERMSKPLQEKLKIARYMPEGTKNVLDVGCADGTVTLALADMYPEILFVGIDLNKDFTDIANSNVGTRKNVRFETGYLRERLSNSERFDVVLFCSVLHEFFSYGEGISTVVKALADAHEIMNIGGTLIIRDMLLYDYAESSKLWIKEMKSKVAANRGVDKLMSDFEAIFGQIESVKQLNHFLLKYMYADNWERESKENYVPVSFEEYDKIFKLLGMSVLFQRSSTIPYLKEKWQNDFIFTDSELESFRSTGIIVARK